MAVWTSAPPEGAVSRSAHVHETLEVAERTLVGFRVGEVRSFRGIRYARPPVAEPGARAPSTKPPWSGVRASRGFSRALPQLPAPARPRVPASAWDLGALLSVDCLTLNVWTAGGAGTRPLPVWLHGGVLIQEPGSQRWYDGPTLARERDAVIVCVR